MLPTMTPPSLLGEAPHRFPAQLPMSDPAGEAGRFARRGQQELAERLAGCGLAARPARLADMPELQVLQQISFRCKPEQLLNDQSLYRVMQFGFAILLHEAGGRIVAYNLMLPIANAERTALSCGFAVHPELAGQGLGEIVTRYTMLEAMVAGCRVRRGTCKPANYGSLAVLLNKCGAICTDFLRPFGCHGETRFEYRLPLTPETMTARPVGSEDLVRRLAATPPGRCRLIDGHDVEAIDVLYRETNFRVVAVAAAHTVAPGGPWLVAVAEGDVWSRGSVGTGALPLV